MIWRYHIQMVLRLPDSWSNWNLELLVFEERGKSEYPEKNLPEQRREPTTNSTHLWHRCRDWNPGHIGGRWALPPLRHPLLPFWQDLDVYYLNKAEVKCSLTRFNNITVDRKKSPKKKRGMKVRNWRWAEVKMACKNETRRDILELPNTETKDNYEK